LPADLPIAAELHRLAFDFEAWDATALGEVLAMPGAFGLLAIGPAPEAKAAPLGLLMGLLVAQDAELLTLAVPPARRRQGVATLLTRDFLRRATAAGALNVFLEVAEDNVPAQHLYSRLGFKMEGKRRGYYQRPGGRTVAAHLLRRSLEAE
jgi:ribosomal-protein-alanine N-acetyltransferase